MFVACRTRAQWVHASPARLQSRDASSAHFLRPPRVYPGQTAETRKYAERKTFLYHNYTRLLQRSQISPMIILQHNHFNTKRLLKLRRDISAAAKRSRPVSLAGSSPPVPAIADEEPKLTIIRSAVLGAALRDFTQIPLQERKRMAGMFSSGIAVLVFPTLHPPQISAVLRAMDRSVPPVKRDSAAEEAEKKRATAQEDPETPGKAMPRIKQRLEPELKVVGALIEDRVFLPDGLRDVTSLPTLETLHQQIVGLISSPASQLVAVLGEAGGGKLSRTLEGLKQSLAGGEDGAPPSQ